MSITPGQALDRLKEGNKRYTAAKTNFTGITAELLNNLYKNGQFPYATILGCSDSRVPVELVFDAGPGELFVIRTPGNVAGPLELGSVEFGVLALKSSLVVVLGHQKCGAAYAAVDGVECSEGMEFFMKEIRQAVPKEACDDPYTACEDENVRLTLEKIKSHPPIANAYKEGLVDFAAGKYSLETGAVTFFDL